MLFLVTLSMIDLRYAFLHHYMKPEIQVCRQEVHASESEPEPHYCFYAMHKQCCRMAKFDPFLSLDCARVEGAGAQSKERKGSNFAA